MTTALESSAFQKKPCYQYIRTSDKLPTIDESLAIESPIAKVKLFDPSGSWTWYVAAYDPETRTAWGLVDGHEKEYGEFAMEELVAIRGQFGLPIERDLYFTPKPLEELAGF